MISEQAEPPTGHEAAPRPGRRRGVVAVVLATLAIAAVAVSAALLLPVDSCGCASPLDLVVQNYGNQEASVSWSQPGLFGTPVRGLSGSAAAPGCRTLSAGLRSGVVQVSVKTGSESRTFSVHVRDAQASLPVAIVIDAAGHVADPIHGAPSGGWRQQESLC